MKDKIREKKKPRIETFAKLITFLVIIHGMACVTASYVLAFLNHTSVENLSITIVTQIVAPCSLYIICNLLANIFEKNVCHFTSFYLFLLLKTEYTIHKCYQVILQCILYYV